MFFLSSKPSLLGSYIGSPSLNPKKFLSSYVAFWLYEYWYHSKQSVTLKNFPNTDSGFSGTWWKNGIGIDISLLENTSIFDTTASLRNIMNVSPSIGINIWRKFVNFYLLSRLKFLMKRARYWYLVFSYKTLSIILWSS